MIITENIIDSYLDCYYKTYLKLANQSGEKHLLEERYENDILECTEKFKNTLSINKKSAFVFDHLTLNPVEFIKSNHYEYFFNINLKVDEYEAKVALKKSIENNQVLFIPVLVIGNEKIKDKHKILLAYCSYVIQLLFLNITDYGEIIYGKNITIKKISFKRFIPKLSLITNTIRKIHENSDQYFFLNKHCKICEYTKTCKSKAIELDHLSLISTIKESDIRQLNSKGIFTVNQLSYTFKPRRKPKRQKTRIRKHFIALKALAIRKKIIYILDTNIELEDVITRIYLDVEGYGETIKFYYLVGIVIEKGSIIIEKSYWISFKEDSKEVYKTLLNELKKYCGDSFTIYHYGKYEIEFLRYLSTTVDDIQEKIFVQKLVSNSKDVLPFFYMKYTSQHSAMI